MAWLTGWQYRKKITLSRASGAVTDYQMKLLVGESSGATGEAVDCGGFCLSNFNDLRFTASDGTTLLKYWIKSITGTTPNQLATLVIKFDSIGESDTDFYMYCGNASASAVSNGADTFIFFADFSSNLGAWEVQSQTWEIISGKLRGSCAYNTSGTILTASPVAPSDNFAVDADVSAQYGLTALNYQAGLCISDVKTSGAMGKGYWLDLSGYDQWVIADKVNGVSFSTANTGFDARVTAEYSFRRNGAAHALYINDVLKVSHTYSWVTAPQYIGCYVAYEPNYALFDNIRVRKYLATEPTWGTWGDLEEEALEVVIPAGSLELSGHNPSISGTVRVDIPAASLILIPHNPSVVAAVERFWVPGGDGDFHSTSNWSATSGGESGASVPSTGDTAKFDNNSFPSGEVGNVDIYSGVLCRIDTSGIDPGRFYINVSEGGVLSLQGDLNNLYGLQVSAGTFSSNDYDISVTDWIDLRDSATVSLGSSILTIGEEVIDQSSFYCEAGVDLDAAEATIILHVAAETLNDSYFESYDQVFASVQLITHPTDDILWIMGSDSYNAFLIIGDGHVMFNGNNVDDVHTILSGSGLTLQGEMPGGLVLESASDPPANFTFSMASGIANATNCSLSNCTGTGGATFNALAVSGNVDGGGNNGWDFGGGVFIPVVRLELSVFNPSVIGPGVRVSIPSAALILASHNPVMLPSLQVAIPSVELKLQVYAPRTGVSAMTVYVPIGTLWLHKYDPHYRWAPSAACLAALQTIYQCILTGAADDLDDLVIPISSFQAMLRQGDVYFVPGWSMLNWILAWGWAQYPLLTELSCVIPNPGAYIAGIAARTNGDIVVKKGYKYSNGSIVAEEICRVKYEALQSNTGAKGGSATVSGHKTITMPVSPDRPLMGVSDYTVQTDGKRVFRAAPDLFLRVGGRISQAAGVAIDPDAPVAIGQISYAVDVLQEIMDVTESGEPAAITFPTTPPTWDEFYAAWGEGANPLDHLVPYGL